MFIRQLTSSALCVFFLVPWTVSDVVGNKQQATAWKVSSVTSLPPLGHSTAQSKTHILSDTCISCVSQWGAKYNKFVLQSSREGAIRCSVTYMLNNKMHIKHVQRPWEYIQTLFCWQYHAWIEFTNVRKAKIRDMIQALSSTLELGLKSTLNG